MVFKLKEFQANSPGVIIFSHKEFIKYSKFKSFNDILEIYKKNYYFGVHWGASYENTTDFNFKNIDINFCYKEQLPDLRNQEIFPYTTRSFIPSAIFNNNENIQKKYDVVTVTRKVNAKFNRDLFKISRELIINNPNIKILILVANPNYVKSNFDHLFDENYENFLGSYKSKNVELITFNEIPKQELVANYLKCSKVFLFTSRKEGVAKVTAEAALCNLPVFINKSFFGGARAGINSNFLFEYDSIKSAVKKINQSLNDQKSNKEGFKLGVSTEQLNDNKNLENLDNALKNFFKSKGTPYKGEIDSFNLKNRMNSYLKELSDMYVSENNDLKSFMAVAKYFENLCEGDYRVSRKLILFDTFINKRVNWRIKDILFLLSPIWLIKIIRRRKASEKELPYE